MDIRLPGRGWHPTMARIPMKFERLAAAFEADADVLRTIKPCESSGSEHSSESFTDLSYLVNSFLEDDDDKSKENFKLLNEENDDDERDSFMVSNYEEMLQSLIDDSGEERQEEIRFEVEDFCRANENCVKSLEFKRKLMVHLRNQGFDAGLCKSRWKKNGHLAAGDYEYVDVNIDGKRYIVEAYIAREFEIARPTARYTSLLDIFPQIYVGKPENLKQIVNLMSSTIRESIRSNGLKLGPWRRKAYMQAKWFGSYKRTINAIPASENRNNLGLLGHKPDAGGVTIRAVGFEALPSNVSYYCREYFGSNTGFRVGNLTAALTSNGLETK